MPLVFPTPPTAPCSLKAKPHMPCHAHAVPMPCCAPAVLQQCRVLRESPRGSRKYPNCYSHRLTDWYTSDTNLNGTLRGSRKKPNVSRSLTRIIWTADANSHMPCHAHAMALKSRVQNGMAQAQHGMCESNMAAPRKVNGKDTI
jgi:hypothetical protein